MFHHLYITLVRSDYEKPLKEPAFYLFPSHVLEAALGEFIPTLLSSLQAVSTVTLCNG